MFVNNYNRVVLTIFNEEAYLTFKPIFHKVLNISYFECEITLESVPGTNQYLAIRVKFLATSTLRIRRATHCATTPPYQ